MRPSMNSASPSPIAGCTSSAAPSRWRASARILSLPVVSRASPASCITCCTGVPNRCERVIMASAESREVPSSPIQTETKPPAGALLSMSVCTRCACPGLRSTTLAPHNTTSGPSRSASLSRICGRIARS